MKILDLGYICSINSIAKNFQIQFKKHDFFETVLKFVPKKQWKNQASAASSQLTVILNLNLDRNPFESIRNKR